MTVSSGKRKHINEILILRAIACLCIVLLHSIAVAQTNIVDINKNLDLSVNSIRVLLTFGTPTFVFISMLLVSYSYPDGLPKDFLRRRVKFILFPYLTAAVCYAAFYSFFSSGSISSMLMQAAKNILGAYHGYFVLIIFQFYILFYFLHSYLLSKKPFAMISVSLAISILYLAIFNFSQPPIDNTLVNYFWARGHWIPFIGWLYYFTLAYYCGKNYSKFLYLLDKYKNYLFTLTLITGSITIALANASIIPLSSKSVAMIFFTTSMIATLYSLSRKIIQPHRFIILISRYSFSIYLFHMVFLSIVGKTLSLAGIDLGIFNTIFLFIGSIFGSIFATFIANKSRFGKYLVGRVNPNKVKKTG